MCGRTACTLAPDEIVQACRYMNAAGQWVYPRWQDPPGGRKYYPSYNLAPSLHSPVLFLSTQNPGQGSEGCESKGVHCDFVIQPMHWGLIPSWHQGDQKSFAYKMNNARSDGLLTKASFKKPLETGQRCVVLVDGYFEWKTSKEGKKQPFFIYFPSDVSIKADQDSVQNEPGKKDDIGTDIEVKQEPGIKECLVAENNEPKPEEEEEELKQASETTHKFGTGNSGKRLLTMAGLYDVWKGKDGETLFSYSVITVDAHKDLEFIHERMPVILNGEEEIRRWLDYKSFPLDKALELVRPTNCLKYHPVTTSVNDSRYKSPDCVEEIDLKAVTPKKSSASSNFMKSWLKTGSSSGDAKRTLEKTSDCKDEPDEKKLKG